jgi:TonB family protein
MASSEQKSPVPGSDVPASGRNRTTHSPSSGDPIHERDVVVAEPSGSGMMPLVGILIALAFGASAWFFYHQGQNDAALGVVSTPTQAIDHGAAPETNPPEANSLAANAGADKAETTVRQSPTSGEPDILMTVHPTATQMQAPAAKPRLAKVARPAPNVVKSAGISRDVALTARPHPVYPAQAMRAHEQGTVMVLAQVDVNGHVSETRVVKRSGSSTLDRAAANEVRGWKFSPALHDGQPIMASVEVPVSYRLDQ